MGVGKLLNTYSMFSVIEKGDINWGIKSGVKMKIILKYVNGIFKLMLMNKMDEIKGKNRYLVQLSL